jgi:hypothetical protein
VLAIRLKALAVGMLLWVVTVGVVLGQVNADKYRDYFLVGQFGEVCTMCEVAVLCEAGDTLPERTLLPEAGSFTLYHLQTRTFWSQVSTVWEWFVSNFSAGSLAARGHTRPVHLYTVTDGNWATPRISEARLILEPGVVEFGQVHIDRIDRSWWSAEHSEQLGYCQRMPLWETLEVIAQQASGG